MAGMMIDPGAGMDVPLLPGPTSRIMWRRMRSLIRLSHAVWSPLIQATRPLREFAWRWWHYSFREPLCDPTEAREVLRNLCSYRLVGGPHRVVRIVPGLRRLRLGVLATIESEQQPSRHWATRLVRWVDDPIELWLIRSAIRGTGITCSTARPASSLPRRGSLDGMSAADMDELLMPERTSPPGHGGRASARGARQREVSMRSALKTLWNGIASLGWLALIVAVGTTVMRPQPVRSTHDRAAPVVEESHPKSTARRASIAQPVREVVEQPGEALAARRILVERAEDIKFPEKEFVPEPSWNVFRGFVAPENRDDDFRYFKLPEPPARAAVAHGKPDFSSGALARARYDNEESRYNIRETLSRLESMGIKVVLDWNGTYGLDSPLTVKDCLDENWEFLWRQQQLNALAEGRPLPAYCPRPQGVSRVRPIGWTQCGSGVCRPDNPYCPYRPGGR